MFEDKDNKDCKESDEENDFTEVELENALTRFALINQQKNELGDKLIELKHTVKNFKKLQSIIISYLKEIHPEKKSITKEDLLEKLRNHTELSDKLKEADLLIVDFSEKSYKDLFKDLSAVKLPKLNELQIKLIDFSQNSKLNQKSILRIIGGIQDAYRPKESNDIVIPDKNLNEIEEEEKNEERKIDPSDTDQKLLILFKSKDIEKEILENDLYREQFDDELSYNIHFK